MRNLQILAPVDCGAIDDLNAFVKKNGLAAYYADIVHFKPKGFQLLAEEVVRVIDATK